jgi:hypothetical protein
MKYQVICPDCGVKEGQIHQFGCDLEICPFCGEALNFCSCGMEIFQKEVKTYDDLLLFWDFELEGKTKTRLDIWLKILEDKGRVPYIEYPIVCPKCGKIDPEWFSVPNSEWEFYISKDVQGKIICKECYSYIKETIERNL